MQRKQHLREQPLKVLKVNLQLKENQSLLEQQEKTSRKVKI